MAGSSKQDSKALDGSILIAGVDSLQGVGAAIARRFGREGYPVVIAGRNTDKLLATRDALAGEGISVRAIVGDVGQAEDVKRFVAAAAELAPLAVAVHNAGSNRPAPFLDQAEGDFEIHWREHALGGYNLARAALPALLARQDASLPFTHGASLIFTGASGGQRGKAGFAAFSAAKGALRNLSQRWHANLARKASMSPMSLSTAAFQASGFFRKYRTLPISGDPTAC